MRTASPHRMGKYDSDTAQESLAYESSEICIGTGRILEQVWDGAISDCIVIDPKW